MDCNSPGNWESSFQSPFGNQEHHCFPLTMARLLLGSHQQPSPAEQGSPNPTSNGTCCPHWTSSIFLLKLSLSSSLLLFSFHSGFPLLSHAEHSHTCWDPGVRGVQQHPCSAGQALSEQPQQSRQSEWGQPLFPCTGKISRTGLHEMRGLRLAHAGARLEVALWACKMSLCAQCLPTQARAQQGRPLRYHHVEESSEHQLPWGTNFT